MKMWYEDVRLGKPMVRNKERHAVARQLYPAECRGRGVTYGGPLDGVLCYQVNSDGPLIRLPRSLGTCPVMVQSVLCHLRGLDSAGLVRRHEDALEQGGYFIVNGIEKLVRLLVVTRRNHPIGLERASYQKKGVGWSSFGVMMRCVRSSAYIDPEQSALHSPSSVDRQRQQKNSEEISVFSDETAQTVTLHFVQDGMMQVRFSLRKQEYTVPLPLILNALVDTTDRQIFVAATRHSVGGQHDVAVTSMLRLWAELRSREGLWTRADCLRYLGDKFAPVIRHDDSMTPEATGAFLLDAHLYIHLSVPANLGISTRARLAANNAKFELLMLLSQKLLSLVAATSLPDNPDAPMHHEVLTAGHLLGIFLREKAEESLNTLKLVAAQTIAKGSLLDWQRDEGPLKRLLAGKLAGALDLGKKCTYFLATGNLSTMTGIFQSFASLLRYFIRL
jgi:DNA-directed RNA polymerase I subunit RPA2